MSKLLFSGVITTAVQLTEPFLQHFKVVEDIYGVHLPDTALWNELVRSKAAEPGVYRMRHSINIPVYFPHSLTRTNGITGCIPLSPSHLRPSQTTDATRPAWHSAKVELRIDPPAVAWGDNPVLPDDISTLGNPGSLCHVSLRLFDLLFTRFIDADAERHKFEKTMTVVNVQIHRKDDLRLLATAPGFRMRYLHTARREPEHQIWHDLLHSEGGGVGSQRNMYTLKLPHLIRIMPTVAGNRAKLPASISVLEADDAALARLGYPVNNSTDQHTSSSNTGLFSGTLTLLLMHPVTNISPITYDLWPDLPQKLTDLLASKQTPPRCRIALYLSDLRFVAMADDHELRIMAGGRRAWKIW